MAQLIQMRQRIKAIDTIKKITHAMRLIAMSTHSRLKSKEESLKEYQLTITSLFSKIRHLNPDWHHEIVEPQSVEKKTLIILIGSQKGLCGNFNTNLFSFFEHYRATNPLENASIIAVGKRVVDYCKEHKLGTLLFSYNTFTSQSLTSIAHEIAQLIMRSQKPYTNVLVFCNELKTFFAKKPIMFTLIPFTYTKSSHDNAALDEYIWEQTPQEILDLLAFQCIDAQLQHLLFESLLAEHASRFISMDNSTRNAQTLLDTTKLDYNKLRQAKITKELSELIGSF